MKIICVKSRQIGTLQNLQCGTKNYIKVLKMEIEVKDLIKTCDYTLDYFFKILRDNGISNRYILNDEDIEKLYLGLEVVNNKSYMLRIELNKIISENSLKFQS